MSQAKNSSAKTKSRWGTTIWVHNPSSSGWTGPQRGLEMQFNVPAEGYWTPGQLKEMPRWAGGLLETL